MSQLPIVTTKFDGGISFSSKSGIPDGYRFSRNLAPFWDVDSITLNPKPIKDSGTTVVDLVKWIVDANPYANVRYAYGDSGKIYKISSNTWSVDHTVGSGSPAGQGLAVLSNALYYTTSTTLGRARYLDNSPSYNDNFLNDAVNNLDYSNLASGHTYTTPTSISETSTDKFTWTPTHDPIGAIEIVVGAKGTGDWTVTLHDDSNNTLATVTVANANITASATNVFTISTAVRYPLGASPAIKWHFHVTSTVADGTVQTGTASDLSTAQVYVLFGILISDSNFHPIIQHTNGVTGTIVIGNGNYMATWDGSTYNPNQIQILPGYNIRGFTKDNEFIVAYAWKGTSIDAFETGYMFYWDGISKYYNYAIPIEGGTPNASINNKNRIFSILGSSGDMNLGNDPFRMIQSAPKLMHGSRIEVLPGAISNWQRRIFFGYSNTNDSNAGNYNYSSGVAPLGMEQGVYEFGNQSDRAVSYTSVSTESLNFAFSPSTAIANQTSFKIGCVFGVGQDLYISYKDGSSYYVDRVNKSNAPCANGSWESLIIDTGVLNKQLAQMPQKTKAALKLVITFAPLPSSCGVTPKYRLDRATNWTLGTEVTTANSTRAEMLISPGGVRYREIEYGFDLSASGSNYPIITGVYFAFDALETEVNES